MRRLVVGIAGASLLAACAIGPEHPPPLNAAVAGYDLEAVSRLLAEGADPNERFLGLRPLNDVANRGDMELMHMLLDAGADPNLAGDGGLTPLHSAAIGASADAARVLLAAGADPCRRAALLGVAGRPSAFIVVRPDLPRERREETLEVLERAEAAC